MLHLPQKNTDSTHRLHHFFLQAEVIRCAAGFCTIRFQKGGGTRLRESRLYPTIAEAEAEISRNKKPASHGEGRMDWLG